MSNDTQTKTGPWLKWAWRHHVLEVDTYDSYEDAVSSAWYSSDAGDESLSCIEGPDGRVIDADEVWATTERDDEDEADDRPPLTHYVTIRQPNGQRDAALEWYHSEAEAEAAADELRQTYGDRVKIKARR